jgi:glycine hydroxymethyltransferase
MAAKAVALTEANDPSFGKYARSVVDNARALAETCRSLGMHLATGGTDNHLMLIDVTPQGITGRQAESALRECGITCNRNSLPNDPNGPWYTSGLRIGTPAITTLGMGPGEMREIASIIRMVLSATRPAIVEEGPRAGQPGKAKYSIEAKIKAEARGRIGALLARFPVYPELDLPFLREAFA